MLTACYEPGTCLSAIAACSSYGCQPCSTFSCCCAFATLPVLQPLVQILISAVTTKCLQRTLSLISSILDSSEETDKVSKAKKPPSRLTASNLTTSVLAKLLLSLLWVAALMGIAFVWIKDFERYLNCAQGRFDAKLIVAAVYGEAGRAGPQPVGPVGRTARTGR